MKFILSSLKLLKAVQSLSGVINSNNTLPILDDFLFNISENELRITASDLETTMVVSIQPDLVEGAGEVTIPARLLIDILKNFPDIPVSFNIDETTLAIEITTGEGRYKMAGHKSDEFPQVPVLQDASQWEIPADVLACGFEKTIFATGNDEIRPVMTGVFMEMTNEGLNFVATDAHKLVRSVSECHDVDFNSSFILPKKPANLLKGVLLKEEEPIRVTFDAKNVIFDLKNHKLVCRLIEGNYPNYNAVIPTANPNKVLVDRVELVNGIKRVAVCSNPTTNLIRMDIADNKVNLTAQDIDFSVSANETISCSYDGQPVTIGFKSTFLVEILSNIDTPTVVVELADSTRAGVFKPVYDDQPSSESLMLLMPMMINA